MAVMLSSSLVFYSPSRIHALLASWEELQALAESPQSAFGLIGPDRDRPTPATPSNARQKGRHADPTFWPSIVADIESAHAHLTSGGWGPAAVSACMTGSDVERYADAHHHSYDEVRALFDLAVDKLAHWLEPYATTSGA